MEDALQTLPPSARPPLRWIFIGPAGARTRTHVDPCLVSAWLTQLSGHKHFTFVQPSDVPHIRNNNNNGFMPLTTVTGQLSEALPPDVAARIIQVTVAPGEILYIPEGWAHEVTCVDDCITLTADWIPTSRFRPVQLAWELYTLSRLRFRCLHLPKHVVSANQYFPSELLAKEVENVSSDETFEFTDQRHVLFQRMNSELLGGTFSSLNDRAIELETCVLLNCELLLPSHFQPSHSLAVVNSVVPSRQLSNMSSHTLRYLCIAHSGLTDGELAALLINLGQCADNLLSLSLCFNSIGTTTLRAIRKAGFAQLRQLDLSHNSLVSSDQIRALLEVLHNIDLTDIDLAACRLGAAVGQVLAAVRHPVRHIALPFNQATGDAFGLLASGCLRFLTALDVSKTRGYSDVGLGACGVVEMCRCISGANHMERITLYQNDITDGDNDMAGLHALGLPVTSSQTLTSLDLEDTQLSDNAGCTLDGCMC